MSNKVLSISERALLAARSKKIGKLLPILVAILGTLVTIMYTVSLMYSKFGSFTITVDQATYQDYGIALCETKDFRSPSPLITCRANESITNIDGKTLDDKDLGSVDGVDNGANYLCYTFYLKNTGQKILTYSEEITIATATLGIEEAARVRVIRKLNDEPMTQIDYAYPKGLDDDGNQIPEEGTEMFLTKNVVLNNNISNFKPGDVMKYTVVIWLEGPDEDCVDSVIGGEFKIDMSFNVDGTSVLDPEQQ